MRKKKQEMLKTHIEWQKVKLASMPLHLSFLYPLLLSHRLSFFFFFQALINRLEKNRGMKPEERANIMKTLKELTEKIAQLQNEMNPSPASQAPGAKPNHSQSKTKTDVSFGPFLVGKLLIYTFTFLVHTQFLHSLLLL